MRDLINALSGVAGRSRDRAFGATRVHYAGVRIAGQASQPVVFVEGVWMENTSAQNQFVSELEVELTRPVKARSIRTEWRQRGRPVITDKGANLPAFGRTESTWDVMLWLGQAFLTGRGEFEGYVKAVGRQGFRARRSKLAGSYDISE